MKIIYLLAFYFIHTILMMITFGINSKTSITRIDLWYIVGYIAHTFIMSVTLINEKN